MYQLTDEDFDPIRQALADDNSLSELNRYLPPGDDGNGAQRQAAPEPATESEAPAPQQRIVREQPGREPSGSYLGQSRERQGGKDPTRAVSGRDGGFDVLGAIAAWTQNPVLMRMLEHRWDNERADRERPAHEAVAAEDRQFKRNAEQRAQEKWQLERDTMAPLKAESKRNENALGASKLEGKQADSPYSQAMRGHISSRLQAEAVRMASVNPDLARMMASTAQSIGTNDKLSADQAERMLAPFAGLGDKVIGDARNAASDAEKAKTGEAQRQHMSQQDQQAWARINAARNKALTPRTGARERAAQIKNQEKLDDEIEKADWAKNMLLDVANLKQHVNTGPLAGRLQNAAQTVGLSSPEFDSMKQRLSQVTNRIIKELSGSAVTGNEWSRMQDELANMKDDDPNFATKLANMIELTDSIKQRAINRYSRQEDGAPSDTTNTAARMTGGKPKVRGSERAPVDATPKAPAGKDDAKADRARKVLADPNMSPKAKDGAKRWLEANGYGQ